MHVCVGWGILVFQGVGGDQIDSSAQARFKV